MHWEVQLFGDAEDLENLRAAFDEPELSVVSHGDQYFLLSSHFDGLSSASAVHDKAKEIATTMSGSARMELGSLTSIQVGSVHCIRDDGKRDITLFPEPGAILLRGFAPTITVGKTDGTADIRRPTDRMAKWLPLAQKDPLIAKALRLRNQESLKWGDLYRIYEVIESDTSVTQIINSGWATKSELQRFKHTANSAAAVGDDARHGKESTQPPAKPLTIDEGRALIDNILRRWLEAKAK